MTDIPTCSVCNTNPVRPVKNQPPNAKETVYTKNCDACSKGIGEAAKQIYKEKRAASEMSTEDEEDVPLPPACDPYPGSLLSSQRAAIICKRQRIAQLQGQLDRALLKVVEMKEEYLKNCEKNL